MEATMMSVNYLAVLVAAAIEFGLGALWFGPLYGKSWMAAHGWTEEDLAGGNPMRSLGIRAVATLVAAFVLAHFVNLAGAETIAAGMQLGFWIWLGFVAVFTLDSVLFEMGSIKAWAINNAYHLVGLLTMAAILAVWK